MWLPRLSRLSRLSRPLQWASPSLPTWTAGRAGLRVAASHRQVDEDWLTAKGGEHMSFDPQFIRPEPEDERKHFKDFVATFGELRFAQPQPDAPERDFVISEDLAEWRFVERLLPEPIVPPLPAGIESRTLDSGFVAPRASPGDYRYHVYRTINHMLPVYSEFRPKSTVLRTTVRRADGDLFALRDDLKAHLFERYQMDFLSQVHEVGGQVVFRGDFVTDFKEFLLAQGF